MMLSSGLLALMGLITLAKGLAISNNATIYGNHGHYATYSFANSDIVLHLHASGYTGKPSMVTLDLANFDKKYQPMHMKSLNQTSHLAERSVCGFFSGCKQFAASSANTAKAFTANVFTTIQANSIYLSILHYWTEDNYANTNAVLQNAIVSLSVNIASTPLTNVLFNQNAAVLPGKDTCNVGDQAKTAEYFASSMYDFCMAIFQAKTSGFKDPYTVNTDFYSGTFKTGDGTVEDGRVAVTRNFIASQADVFGPSCLAFGIKWKRAVEFFGIGAK